MDGIMKAPRFSIITGAIVALLMSASQSHSWTYATATKTAIGNGVVTAIDAGGAAAKLEIGTAAMAVVLCTFTLNFSPAGMVATNVVTLAGFAKSCTAANSGTAAAARIRTSANADVLTGMTAGTSGTDVILQNTSINTNQVITITVAPTLTIN